MRRWRSARSTSNGFEVTLAIRTLVVRIASVTSNPFEVDLALRHLRIQLLPQVDVLPPLPAERHRLDHVLAVAANGHLDTGCYCAQRLDHRRYLHPVVRGRRVAAAELALTPVGLQDEHAPSARPWIADTGAVGISDRMRLARRHPLTHALPLRSS